MFTVKSHLPGIHHVCDVLGVCFTLLEGRERALLFDTGYGLEDVREPVASLTDRPLTVLLSHGHHDHILGARWFENTFLCQEDLEEFFERTGEDQRAKVRAQALGQRLSVPDDFMTAGIAAPQPLRFTEKAGPFDRLRIDLGGLEVQAIHVPGHTPGSIVLYVPDRDLLLTGDDWNPCTWMWFPTSDAADLWRGRMLTLIRTLESESGREIRHVLCSHQPDLRTGNELKAYLAYMTEERMRNSPPVTMGSPIDTHEVRNDREGWQLVFDYGKLHRET